MNDYSWELFRERLFFLNPCWMGSTDFPMYGDNLKEFLRQETEKLARLPVNYGDVMERVVISMYKKYRETYEQENSIERVVNYLTELQLRYLASQTVVANAPTDHIESYLIELLNERFGGLTIHRLKEDPELRAIQISYEQSKGFELLKWINRLDDVESPEEYEELDNEPPPIVLSGQSIFAAILEIANRPPDIDKAKESIIKNVNGLMMADVINALSGEDVISKYEKDLLPRSDDVKWQQCGKTTTLAESIFREKLIAQILSELESINTGSGDKAT